MARMSQDEIRENVRRLVSTIGTLVEKLGQLDRHVSRGLLEALYDGYAAANFDYQDGYFDGATLDEAEVYLALADFVARNCSQSFPRHAIEEIYSPGKDQTPEARVLIMIARHGTSSVALSAANCMKQWVNGKPKLVKWWEEVIALLNARQMKYMD